MSWFIPPNDTYFAKILERTPEGFELDHLKYALTHVHSFRSAVDAGAHIGTWSVALAKLFERVFSFEPAPETFECLAKNTRDYPNIRAFEVALGASPGLCKIVEDPTRIGNTGSNMVGEGKSIQLYSLDHNLVFYDLDFLKIDVEGYEVEVLKGAVENIQRCSPVILMECKEFSPKRHGGTDVSKQFLKGLGYINVGGIHNDQVFVRKGYAT